MKDIMKKLALLTISGAILVILVNLVNIKVTIVHKTPDWITIDVPRSVSIR